jgi:hypothetical protein
MPRLKVYWNGKANAMMTPSQSKATAERYALWQHDRDLNSKARWNASSVERARQWTLAHPEEAKERRRKAREARKERRMADPEYAAHHTAKKAQHRANYRKAHPEAKRTEHLKQKGWTAERYGNALQEQGNCCAICKEAFTTTPCADHAHTVQPLARGLLCNGCNSAIGFLRDNPLYCEAAAAYLRAWAV